MGRMKRVDGFGFTRRSFLQQGIGLAALAASLVDDAEHAIVPSPTGARGRLRVAASDTAAAYYLGPFWRALRHDHPELRIDVSVHNSGAVAAEIQPLLRRPTAVSRLRRAAVVAGVLPALHATGRRAQDTLKQASGTDGLRLGRVWTAMIIAQVAIAVIGLPAIIKISWDGIQRGLTRANYSEESFLAAIISADPDAPAGMAASVDERESVLRFEKLKTDLVTSLEAEPAVDDVTVASTIPGSEPRARVAIDGAVNVQSGALEVGFNRVATDFFDAFGARIIAGRSLRDSDGTGSAQAIVVNRAFVEQLLGGTNAVGRRVQYVEAGARAATTAAPTTQYEIVGVMSDLSSNTLEPALIEPVIYHSLRSSTRATALIRMRGNDPLQFSSRLRELTSALDPTLRLRIVTFSEMKRQAQIGLRLMLLGCLLVVVTVLLLSLLPCASVIPPAGARVSERLGAAVTVTSSVTVASRGRLVPGPASAAGPVPRILTSTGPPTVAPAEAVSVSTELVPLTGFPANNAVTPLGNPSAVSVMFAG